MKLLSFDVEISDIFELQQHENMEKYAPFHISIAATAVFKGEERAWCSRDQDGYPMLNLTQEDAHDLLEYLDEMQQKKFMAGGLVGLQDINRHFVPVIRRVGLAGGLVRAVDGDEDNGFGQRVPDHGLISLVARQNK